MFKRFSFSLIFFLLGLSFAQAQLTKGTRLISLSDGANNSAYRTPLTVYGGLGEVSALFRSGPDAYVFQLAPKFGYFLSDHVLLGGELYFNYTTLAFDNSQTIIGVAPFARYYFNPAATSGTHFFGELSLGYVKVLNEDGLSFVPLSISGGVTHMLAPNISLDGFVRVQNFDIIDDFSRSLTFGASFNVFLDQEVYDNRKSTTAGIQAGTMMVGGSSGALRFDLDGGNGRSFSIEPQFFYFLNPQFALGTGVLVGFSSRKNEIIDFASTNLGVSPQLRYYLNSDARKLFFVGAGVNIEYDRFTSESSLFPDSGTSSETMVDFALGAGMSSFVSSNVALEIGPSIRIDPGAPDVRLGIDFGVQVFLNTAEKESSPNDFGG
ncbi:MAG: hypothetical protein AAFP77_24370 [Bacteroidota bacterium]